MPHPTFKVGDEVRGPSGRVGVIVEFLRANRDYRRRAVIEYSPAINGVDDPYHRETIAVRYLRAL